MNHAMLMHVLQEDDLMQRNPLTTSGSHRVFAVGRSTPSLTATWLSYFPDPSSLCLMLFSTTEFTTRQQMRTMKTPLNLPKTA
jgi:hypothetical protein